MCQAGERSEKERKRGATREGKRREKERGGPSFCVLCPLLSQEVGRDYRAITHTTYYHDDAMSSNCRDLAQISAIGKFTELTD